MKERIKKEKAISKMKRTDEREKGSGRKERKTDRPT